METELYTQIFNALEAYVKEHYTDMSVSVCHYSPEEPAYPIVILDETRNTPYSSFKGFVERVASIGYRIDIYARTVDGEQTKQSICRALAKVCDEFMTGKAGLRQISWNAVDGAGTNGELYRVMITYTGAYLENKQRIL